MTRRLFQCTDDMFDVPRCALGLCEFSIPIRRLFGVREDGREDISSSGIVFSF